MKMRKFIGILLFVAVCGFMAGCGKKADENKPVEQVRADAEKMSVAGLRDMATSYKDAILAKKGEITKLGDKLAEIPLADKLGSEAQNLGKEISQLTASMTALTERFNVYIDQLKAKGEDISKLSLEQ